jgi:hypothetical protein
LKLKMLELKLVSVQMEQLITRNFTKVNFHFSNI